MYDAGLFTDSRSSKIKESPLRDLRIVTDSRGVVRISYIGTIKNSRSGSRNGIQRDNMNQKV